MSAFRVLGFCYLATASIFALAIAAADQARLRDAADAAGRRMADQIEGGMLQPVLNFARAVDQQFFDPPQRSATLALGAPGPNDARTYAHATVPPRPQARLVDRPPPEAIEPLMIAPDLPPLETEGSEEDASGPSQDTGAPETPAQALVRARLERSLTPELRDNFDLFLFISKAARGPAAQRLYVFRKEPQGRLKLVHDWAASTGRERYEISPLGYNAFTATPSGIYQFDPARMYRHYTSRAWNGEMPYAMFFNWERAGARTGMAIHAATARNVSRLGRRDSAGCIHISPRHAALLYNMIRSDYRGKVPRFAYDANGKTMSNRGDLAHDGGQLEMTDGYRVLIDIEDVGAEIATLY